ncbi:MAG: diaminopimelate decarboxylase, partial [Pseudomonadota bacterium]
VFWGVGKRVDELERALEVGIHSFNVESLSEIDTLAEVARAHGTRAAVSLRINPDVDAHTHPYISTGLKENKFGIAHDIALDAYRQAAGHPALEVIGIDCHIGSQLTEVQPFVDAADRLLGLIDQLAAEGIAIRELDLGGGQGVVYRDEQQLDLQAWQVAMSKLLDGRDLTVIVEPGRAIVANAGLLLTRVNVTKENGGRHFAVVDAAMNDLIRPALYQAWQTIEAVETRNVPEHTWDIVGPVCESADFLGKERPLAIDEGHLLAVRSAGAYCAVMSSNYNTRPRSAEVLVDNDTAHLVRRRETVADLFAGESVVVD